MACGIIMEETYMKCVPAETVHGGTLPERVEEPRSVSRFRKAVFADMALTGVSRFAGVGCE